MAKRFHDGLKGRVKRLERHEESEHGMRLEHLGSGYFTSHEERVSEEREAGGMISADRTAFANLPQNVIMKEYPKTYGAAYPELDDTMRSVDASNEMDAKKTKHERFPSKY